MPGYVEGKDKNQILKEMVGTAMPASAVYEQQRMGIIVRCTEDLQNALTHLEKTVDIDSARIEEALGSLRNSMDSNAHSADRLATKVFWLNVILVGATVVAAATGIAQVLVALHK